MVQFWITKFSDGTFILRPSLLRPDLIAMSSSPELNVTPVIKTSLQDSGSTPSLFGPKLLVVRDNTKHEFNQTHYLTPVKNNVPYDNIFA